MKRLLLFPGLLLLALTLRAQDSEEPSAPVEEPAVEEPSGDIQHPQAEAQTAGAAPSPESSEGEETQEPEIKEEPMISIKVVGASEPKQGDEESIEPALPAKKVVPTATIMPIKKGRKTSPAKAAKSNAVKTAPVVAKVKTPPVTAPVAPLVPAVPLTPITPRNP